mgnify:FL=1
MNNSRHTPSYNKVIVMAKLVLLPGPTESSAISPSSKIFIYVSLLVYFAGMSSPDLDRDSSSDDGSVQSNTSTTSTSGDWRSEPLRRPRVPTPPPVPADDAEQDDVFNVSSPE